MNAPRLFNSMRTKLLLSYLLVIAAGIGGLALGVQLVGPSLFDRMLTRHMSHDSGMMGAGMTEAIRQSTTVAFRESIFQAVLISTVVASIVAVVISIVVATRITAPLRRIAAGSRQIAVGDYSARIGSVGDDEIRDLAESFNLMAAALEDAEHRRVQLIGDVAHELRTPVTSLRGNFEGLLDGVVVPEPALWAQLHGETARLERLIDDLQHLSRVEAGQLALDIQPVSVVRLIERAVTALSAQYAEKDVAIHVDAVGDLRAIAADAGRTSQVLTNLLTNALRHTPSGGEVTISTREDNDSVVVDVKDTGIGIDAEHLPRVFDRFYRVDPARSRARGGSGIGLAIVKALVEAQGGRVWATSPGPGKGCVFSFTLPVARTP